MANNTASIGFSDYASEQADIERRRKYAEMLRDQSMDPLETKMAGGWAIPTAPTQYLAKALQGYVSDREMKKLKDEQAALGQRARTEATDWVSGMPQPQTRDLNLVQNDDEGNAMPAALQTTQPSRQQMMAHMLKGVASGNPMVAPMAGSVAAQYMKPEDPYNLREGEKRFGPGNAPVAENPKTMPLHFGNTGTAIQGFDPRTGTPQGPATPVHPAPVRNDPNKPFMPDGTPNKAFQAYQTGLRKEGAPKVSVTVPVNTEKKYGEAFAGKIADADVSLRDAAEKAPQLAERANRIKQVLATGNTITGFGADFRLGFAKAAELAGLGNGSAADTESLAAGLAQNTMDAIKASGMGGGTGFSNADRDFLEKAVGGKVNLEPQAISRLADLAHRAASLTAERWTKRAAQIPKSAIEGTGIDTSPQRVPPLFGGGRTAADKPIAPYSDPAKEREYQEWKRKNGG